MLRLLYISGMLFFAILIGDTASRLREQYKEGSLFEQYNSQRKADITLFTVSVCGLATLACFEVARSRRRRKQADFVSMESGQEPVADGVSSDNIYAAPETIDEWQGRPPRIPRSQGHPGLSIVGLWMGLLRIYCGVLPVIYLYTLLNYLFFWLPGGAGNWFLSILFPLLMLGAALTSAGILRKKRWGLHAGYAMAIFHLLIFPVGTAIGFVMLIGLMGATSEFDAPKRLRS